MTELGIILLSLTALGIISGVAKIILNVVKNGKENRRERTGKEGVPSKDVGRIK
jgi:hypothetical protein